MKAPTPAQRSVSTDVYGWSSTVPLLPQIAGLLACRELDDALGLTETIGGVSAGESGRS